MDREFKIILCPWLAHGHVSPFVELAKRLSTKNFKTYICTTPVNLATIQIPSHYSVELVPLHMPASPELPPELHTTRNLPPHLLVTLMQAFQLCESSFSEILSSLKPHLLIYDILQPWSAKLASSMGIPSVFFAMMGAAFFSYYHHIYTNGSHSTYPFRAINLFDDERFNPRAMDRLIKGVENEYFYGSFKQSTDIVLIKSYGQIEAKYVDYLSDLCKKKVMPTGPLIAAEPFDVDVKEGTAEIMNWLSDKTRFSTIYISFGSECQLSKDEMHQLAKGLELSGANFLWVIRFSYSEKETSLEEVLPEGFIERTKDRGMLITKWAPQARILAHQSIAAFISHCGWSSVTESLYFSVPIIAMPMQLADRPVNAALLVESGAGVKIERRPDEIYTGEAIAKTVNEVVFNEMVYRNMKNRAVELSNAMKEKEELEGNGVAEELRKLCMNK